MNITECTVNTQVNKDELIPTVLEHIFVICKEDKHFDLKEKNTVVDNKLNLVNSKLKKQNSLFEQSEKIKKDLLEKLKNIDDESFTLKYKILETLGSEI